MQLLNPPHPLTRFSSVNTPMLMPACVTSCNLKDKLDSELSDVAQWYASVPKQHSLKKVRVKNAFTSQTSGDVAISFSYNISPDRKSCKIAVLALISIFDCELEIKIINIEKDKVKYLNISKYF